MSLQVSEAERVLWEHEQALEESYSSKDRYRTEAANCRAEVVKLEDENPFLHKKRIRQLALLIKEAERLLEREEGDAAA